MKSIEERGRHSLWYMCHFYARLDVIRRCRTGICYIWLKVPALCSYSSIGGAVSAALHELVRYSTLANQSEIIPSIFDKYFFLILLVLSMCFPCLRRICPQMQMGYFQLYTYFALQDECSCSEISSMFSFIFPLYFLFGFWQHKSVNRMKREVEQWDPSAFLVKHFSMAGNFFPYVALCGNVVCSECGEDTQKLASIPWLIFTFAFSFYFCTIYSSLGFLFSCVFSKLSRVCAKGRVTIFVNLHLIPQTEL